MEFSWIKTFVTVAEQQNFRKAAEVLYISQPSVTVHIKQLEKELGILLFNRTNKRVSLTEEGRCYLETARKLLKVYQEGGKKLHSMAQGYKSTFRMAISPLIADTILPYVLKQYLLKHSNIEISVIILESRDIEEVVINEEVDIGLSCMQSFNPQLTNEIIYEDEVILVAPHDGMDPEFAPPITEEELFNQYHLLTHNHPEYWEKLLKRITYMHPSAKTMKVSQVHITKRFIEEGLGVSFIPRSTVRRELLEGRLLEVQSDLSTSLKANTYAIVKYQHTLEKEFLRFLTYYRYI
ncbi:MAG: LysR family transcriptional regulator [Bacillota bacterium]|uniref:LysR family transcriptional regulator n=1 Tax=Virgibacillus TaxID=84406 RepID=UPI00041F1EA0|nr:MULTISPECIES: LysR family transcriptional regulator [Bacillaceae]MCC2251340.1 LysR family transcriptional regulator [Virgibacillus sp. AGTR]MDY7043799.1 LysR family transcriptional regulator [Virgibacillus sp. M23]QRZ19457.1 LysR family transcriptional regulator [Virgibacillus sp. AGTR]WBX80868.1 LysR family transcriptional regulator [Virgibacillus salarius]